MKRVLTFLLALMLMFPANVLCAFADSENGYEKLSDFRITVDGDVYQTDVYIDNENNVLLSPSVVKQLFGFTPPVTKNIGGMLCASLEDVCESSGVQSYEFDEVLSSAYIWTNLYDNFTDEHRIAYYNLGTVSDKAITYKEMFKLLDKAVKIADKSKLKGWQKTLAAARKSTDEMTRCEGMTALLYAGIALGANYTEYNAPWWIINDLLGGKMWDEMDAIYMEFDPFRYFPNEEKYSHGGFDGFEWDTFSIAYRYAFGRKSLLNGNTLFDYDSKQNSMRPADKLTVKEALCAVSRLLDSVKKDGGMIKLTDPAARNYNKTYITDELIAHAKKATLKDVGDWRGMVLYADSEDRTIDANTYIEGFRRLSEWGFDSVRVMLTYQTLFDKNVNRVNEPELEKLDALVAAAIRYNIHLNITTFQIPGRWAGNDAVNFTSIGEFDLFSNAERQAEVVRMWSLLSERYKDIPSASISYCPMWEPGNYNLSTGQPYKEYTAEDIANIYVLLAKTIRKYDKEKLIVYEPLNWDSATELSSGKIPSKEKLEKEFDNVAISIDFYENAYIYAGMIAEQGVNIDNCNHSVFETPYPTTFYSVQCNIENGEPLQLRGALFKGTTIDLYLKEASCDGVISIKADGKELYNETLTKSAYNVGNQISGFYTYAKSDKKISVTIPLDTNLVEISFSGNTLSWSGMDVTLPEEYSVSRWWYPSGYDTFNGGEASEQAKVKTSTITICPNSWNTERTITINSDITYATATVFAEANKQTIDNWGKLAAKVTPSALIRCENASFSGTTIQSALAYYEDFLKMCDKYGLGWLMNEYGGMTMFTEYNGYSRYGNSEYTPYRGNYLLTEMLQLFQRYTEKPTKLTAKKVTTKLEAPAISAAVSKGKVTLKWNEIPLADSYRVYMATTKNGKYSYINNAAALSYIKKKLASGKTYYFKIKACAAINGKKYFSDYSEIISIKL